MHRLIGIILCGFSIVAQAACPVGDQLAANATTLTTALSAYTRCALDQNDDSSQLLLAQAYRQGKQGLPQNTQRALLFYHLSAENGNATAMVELSALLTQLDETDQGRSEIENYLDKIQSRLNNGSLSSFRGQLLHPYALLMLAAEKPESKWFYTTQIKTDPRAARQLKAYQIEEGKKAEIIRQATAWKQRKLNDAAASLLTVSELKTFYKTVYPQNSRADSFARSQAIERLKEKFESRFQ